MFFKIVTMFFDNLCQTARCCLQILPFERKDTMGSTIKDEKLFGIKISEYFSVRLSENSNPSINPTVNLDHMPVKVMAKLVHEALKVRGRPAMKKLPVEKLKEVYKGEISWRVLYSHEGATRHQKYIDMSDEEVKSEIERLNVLIRRRPAANNPPDKPSNE